MSQTIYVDKQAALDAAKGFETEAQAVDDANAQIMDVASLLETWEGDAATQAKATLDRVEECMIELTTGIMAHASLVTSSVQTFSSADDKAAAALTTR